MRVRKLMRSTVRISATVLALAVVAAASLLVSPGAAHAATVRELQWYLDALRIPQAHKVSKGRGVTVAVIDTGVDATHPALKGQVLNGHGITIDAAPDGRRDSDTERGHGTAMAGIIAGRGGSDMQQLGIAPEAKILPVSMSDRFGTAEIAEAIRWAVNAGADVINLSVRGGEASADAHDAVRYALDNDVVLVASTGNTEQGNFEVGTPANIPGVIAVTGTTKSGDFSPTSVQGAEAVLAAPMEAIIGPVPFSVSDNGYGVASGTSDAAAIVSGIVALVRAKHPDLDAANVINRLVATAQDKGPRGRDPQYGFGLVDPMAALTAEVASVKTNPLLSDGAQQDDAGRPVGRSDGEDEAPFSIGLTKNPIAWAIQIGLILLVVVAVIILITVNRRAAQRRASARPMGPPMGPGLPPPGGQSPPYMPPAGPAGYPGRPPGSPPDAGARF